MKTYRIAVVGGDGIGPEVIAGAVEVLAAAAAAGHGIRARFRSAPAGAGTYLEQGEALPETTLDDLPRAPTRSCWAPAGCPACAIRTGPRSFPR